MGLLFISSKWSELWREPQWDGSEVGCCVQSCPCSHWDEHSRVFICLGLNLWGQRIFTWETEKFNVSWFQTRCTQICSEWEVLSCSKCWKVRTGIAVFVFDFDRLMNGQQLCLSISFSQKQKFREKAVALFSAAAGQWVYWVIFLPTSGNCSHQGFNSKVLHSGDHVSSLAPVGS